MIEQKYRELKERVDELKRERAQAEGVLKQLRQQLKSEHGVTSLQAAEKRREELQQELEFLRNKFEHQLDEFSRKWE